MHIVTKTISGKPYLYLAWHEQLGDKRAKRYQYLGKSPRAAVKKLSTLDIADKDRLINSLDGDVWETPVSFLGLVGAVMGGIDLDPATKPSNPTGADRFYTKDDDGLTQPWAGRVYLNPPYSKPAPFLLRLIESYRAGLVTEAIALCKQGVLSNKGTCKPIAETAAAVCLWQGRLNFTHSRAKDRGNSANFDVTAIYWGSQADRFREVFSPHGAVR